MATPTGAAHRSGFRDFAKILLLASATSLAFSLMDRFSLAEQYLADRSIKMAVLLSVILLLHGYLCIHLPTETEHGVSRRRGLVMLTVNLSMTALCIAALFAEKSGAAETAHLLTWMRALPSLLLMLLAIRALQLEPKPEKQQSLFEDQADALLQRQEEEH